eukprot:GSA25T00016071001.1
MTSNGTVGPPAAAPAVRVSTRYAAKSAKEKVHHKRVTLGTSEKSGKSRQLPEQDRV